jgi:cell division septation protein DedD
MSELAHAHDDQSHYEISLTAGQAFVAFVLLLLSLAASFAFGLMIGKGQADERLVVRKEPEIVSEASAVPVKAKKADAGKIVELAVPDDEFQPTDTAPVAATDTTVSAAPAQIIEEGPAVTAPVTEPPAAEAAASTQSPQVPHFAQLLSSGDQKAAEGLAAKLIERGFSSAYVERGANEKGPIFRVRVKFPSEAEARAAETRLKEFSKEVWITK